MSDSRIREREGGSRRVGDTTRDQIVPDQVPPPPIEEPGKNQSRANPRGRGERGRVREVCDEEE
jgi:hypothetical protein